LAKAIEDYINSTNSSDVSRMGSLFDKSSLEWAKNYN